MKLGTKVGGTFIERRALDIETGRIVAGEDGKPVLEAHVSVSRFWLPFLAAEMVSPWYWKPVAFAVMAWLAWVRREI